MISLINIEKRYHVGKNSFLAIDGVSLEIAKGSIFGIIGESGAGKTSLLRCINLLERPDAGCVIVAGQDLMALSSNELRKQRQRIGMIFQHFNLLSSRSVFDNIALPLMLMNTPREQIAAIIAPLIKLTGLCGKENNYPHELSGGQKQRVAIARALATKPDVLLCDEATSALDQKTTQSILDLLATINQQTGLTIVLITHEIDVVKTLCDTVALMDHGKIIEIASIVDFFSRPSTPLAQTVVERALKMPLPMALLSEIGEQTPERSSVIIRIVFRGHLTKEAIISHMSRRYLVDVSIMQATIEMIGHGIVGFLVAQVQGSQEQVNESLAYLSSVDLDYTVVSHGV